MDREINSNYSIISSHSRISYTSNMYNFIQDSNIYNNSNFIEMLHNIRQESANIVEENSVNNPENVDNNPTNVNQAGNLSQLNNSNFHESINTINSSELFGEMSMLAENNQQEGSILANDEQFLDEPDYLLLHNGRASTAPAKPVNELEEFKYSSQYINLEKVVYYANKLIILKPEGKFDVDSEEGSETCKKFLEHVEKLITSLKVPTYSREYRKTFSKAYVFLYQEDSLCYLTEILDSAQEGIPFLVVNGERFVFSPEVLDFGNQLYITFCTIIELIRECFQKLREESFIGTIKQIKLDLKRGLSDFDRKWVAYEEKYINELIYIEKESRRFILQAIELEKELTQCEIRARCRGKYLLDSEEYNSHRSKLVNIICEINKVANTEGKGRDDLTVDILITAEGVLRKVSNGKSRPVRNLAEKIKQCFLDMRKLFQKYEKNIEGIDPQLKNNPDLVESLFTFEATWEKGKEFLVDFHKYSQLLFFSQMIDVLCEKYSSIHAISELIESRDPSIFVIIPSILLIKSLDSEGNGICEEFIPHLNDINEESGKIYSFLKGFQENLYESMKDNYAAYNMLEKLILFEDSDSQEEIENEIGQYINRSTIREFKKYLKILSMHLQRYKPTEWNNFFDVAMNIQQ